MKINKKTVGSGLIFAGGFIIITGLGNYYVKSYNPNYLLFMLIASVVAFGCGYYMRKK